MMHEKSFNKILLSRTDNIGDVILTLPMAGVIKKYYPQATIGFLGKKYTKPIIDTCTNIDEFFDWDEINISDEKHRIFRDINYDTIIHVFPNKEIAKIAKKANIKNRIGTNRRLYHWLYCNNLINLSRKKSKLHESQLNLKLLESLLIKNIPDFNEIPNFYNLQKIGKLQDNFLKLIDPIKFNIILHPKSKGSAREWETENFIKLANSLQYEKYNIFFSGDKNESTFIKKNIISKCHNAHDISGLFSLSEFISFINLCDGLIANSTGPLHIAAALGINTLGLYPPIKNMSPKRWAPIGFNSEYILGKNTNNQEFCEIKCDIDKKCYCMDRITPPTLIERIEKWKKINNK